MTRSVPRDPRWEPPTVRDLVAQFGPQGDKTQSLTCNGKGFTFYNAGPGEMTLFIEGPADQCGGIDYLAPLPVTYTTKGKSTTFKIAVAEQHHPACCRASSPR